jgi:AraC-like DNA-binding protein
MDIAVPFRELINVVTLAQALIFAGILLANRFRKAWANRILIFSFIIIASVKIDQMYQMMGGLEVFPSVAFIFTPIQWLLTPSLYFFVLAKVRGDFIFKRLHLWHLVPAVASLIYLSATYFFLPIDGKIAYIASGVLREPLNALVIPIASDLIQLGYLIAALHLLAVYGVTLRNWFSQIDDIDVLWVRRVWTIWVVAFLGHLLFTISIRVFEWYGFGLAVLDLLNVMHLLLVNALMILAVVGHFASLSTVAIVERREKYVGSDQTSEERRALFSLVQKEMVSNARYLQMDLNLGELAASIAVTPRDLSEAINAEGGVSFYDFVNGYRLEAARAKLLDEPDAKVLNIAHGAGFNSKSTFNKVFKSATGQTPSEFRKSQLPV